MPIPVTFPLFLSQPTWALNMAGGYDAGAVDYMFKPLDPQMLLSKVHVFLEIYR